MERRALGTLQVGESAGQRGIGVIVMEPLDKGRYVKGLRRQQTERCL